jgi:hypothetical protein
MASVFFSYSHKDEALRDQLEAHLSLLRNQGLIDVWYDRRIVAGDAFDAAIFKELETADIILLLVSSDFLNSTYCFAREMGRAMERHNSGATRVIPVILRHCDWQSSPFGSLMAAPRDGKPVVSWPDQDEALADVAKQVRRAVESIPAVAPRIPASAVGQGVPAQTTVVMDESLPRSSNLRLKKEFTEKDCDDFLRDTFEFVCRFFQGSLEAIEQRNPGITGSFEKIDSRRMAAMLYRNGKKLTECSVRLDGLGRSNGIAFSHNAATSSNSWNEMLNVHTSDQYLYLKSMGMAWNGDGSKHLSQEGAAEFLWDLFIKQAQV